MHNIQCMLCSVQMSKKAQAVKPLSMLNYCFQSKNSALGGSSVDLFSGGFAWPLLLWPLTQPWLISRLATMECDETKCLWSKATGRKLKFGVSPSESQCCFPSLRFAVVQQLLQRCPAELKPPQKIEADKTLVFFSILHTSASYPICNAQHRADTVTQNSNPDCGYFNCKVIRWTSRGYLFLDVFLQHIYSKQHLPIKLLSFMQPLHHLETAHLKTPLIPIPEGCGVISLFKLNVKLIKRELV